MVNVSEQHPLPRGGDGATERGEALPYQNPGKLVRDKVPEVIRSRGKVPIVRTAGQEEYSSLLRCKLCEEAEEFLVASEEEEREELADVLEVVHALAADLGMSMAELEELRRMKWLERGGFTTRTVWQGNEG